MYSIMKQGSRTDTYVNEYVVDTVADISTLPVAPQCAIGSTCLVVDEGSVYMLNNANEWIEIGEG